MTTTAPAPPARPIVPRPLWERRDLFQEPAYPEGLGPLEDEDEDQDDAIITP
jgi:hypothetical protein